MSGIKNNKYKKKLYPNPQLININKLVIVSLIFININLLIYNNL
jgi:hypothetical protein